MPRALTPFTMSNQPPRYSQKTTRVQTTVSILEAAVSGVDELAIESGVSRSRLVDLAVRRFLRWAANLDPRDLQLIAEYEVTEPISGFQRRPSGTLVAPQVPELEAVEPTPELPRPKVLSSSAPVSPPPTVEDTGPVTPHRERRIPVEETPRLRNGQYSDIPGRKGR